LITCIASGINNGLDLGKGHKSWRVNAIHAKSRWIAFTGVVKQIKKTEARLTPGLLIQWFDDQKEPVTPYQDSLKKVQKGGFV
jgi:hypothetical protein